MFGLQVLQPTRLLSIYLAPLCPPFPFALLYSPYVYCLFPPIPPFLCRMSAPLLIFRAPFSIPNLSVSPQKPPLAHPVVCITAGSREVWGDPATPGAHRAWLLAAVSHP